MKTYKFKIEGLDCANCANELEGALEKIDKIENVSISFMTEKLSFECMEDDIEDALKIVKKVIKTLVRKSVQVISLNLLVC